MHDVIIDDTRTSLAVTTDKGYREPKKTKKRSFSSYLIDWVEKALIVATLLCIDFLIFAGAGSYNMFSSMTFLSLEVWYILFGIFILSIVLMYILSFSSVMQNILTAMSVSFFVVIMLNQFAAFDKNSMLSKLASTYVSQDLGLLLNNVSHIVLAGIIGFIFFLFLSWSSKKIIAYLVIFLMLMMGIIIFAQFMGGNEHQKFKIVKDDVITPNSKVGKKFVFIALPTVGSYNYINDFAEQERKNQREYESLRKTLDIMLGFYSKNNFTLYPHAYVNDIDPYNNMAQSLNANNPKKMPEYMLNNISVNSFWKFNNVAPKYVYLKENKLFDTFKRANYGINAYQAGGIEMCSVNNEMVVERCIEKNSLPVDFDDMNLNIEQKVEVLMAQWLESMGVFDDFSYVYDLLRPFVDVDTLPMIGISYKNINVKNSLDTLDMLEKDIDKDNGNKAYFLYLNLPSNTFIYDEFCRVKPIDKWQNKRDLPWAKKIGDQDKRRAYAEQLRCVFGRLERFLNKLDNSDSAKKTVVVIQGVSGINGMTKSTEKNFLEDLRNKKYVDMAIRDPLKKSFQVEYDICSAPNILKQYLYRQGKCPELKEFNLHIDALKEMRASLKNLNLDKSIIDKSEIEFDKWYQEWLKANSLKAYAATLNNSGSVISIPVAKNDNQEAKAKTGVETVTTENVANETVVSEVDGVLAPKASDIKTIPEISEAPLMEKEKINDEIPEKVIGAVKTMAVPVKEAGEAAVSKLKATVAKEDVVKAVPEPKQEDVLSNPKLNIVIDNTNKATANDNIPVENGAKKAK